VLWLADVRGMLQARRGGGHVEDRLHGRACHSLWRRSITRSFVRSRPNHRDPRAVGGRKSRHKAYRVSVAYQLVAEFALNASMLGPANVLTTARIRSTARSPKVAASRGLPHVFGDVRLHEQSRCAPGAAESLGQGGGPASITAARGRRGRGATVPRRRRGALSRGVRCRRARR